eukprot:scaffold3622_cov145-Skeletonema_dohrnii-CCMP3373.AAC.6
MFFARAYCVAFKPPEKCTYIHTRSLDNNLLFPYYAKALASKKLGLQKPAKQPPKDDEATLSHSVLCQHYEVPVQNGCHLSTATLKQRQHDSNHARSMNLSDVALFKGRGDADAESIYGQPGIVHRSPRIEESGESRVILIIDIPQEGWHFD